MNTTSNLFDEVILKCVNTFSSKMKDYGSAWRILRLSSLTDQIFIKAQRIRSLQIKKEKKIDEGQEPEFIGIINYSIMALIQIEKGISNDPDMNIRQAIDAFNNQVIIVKDLMLRKVIKYLVTILKSIFTFSHARYKKSLCLFSAFFKSFFFFPLDDKMINYEDGALVYTKQATKHPINQSAN